MTQYRILQQGRQDRFIIQWKGWFLWHTHKEWVGSWGGGEWYNCYYPTKEAAVAEVDHLRAMALVAEERAQLSRQPWRQVWP